MNIRYAIVFGCIFCCGGCTLAQMNRESDAMAQRIPVKEQQLYDKSVERNNLLTEQEGLKKEQALLQSQQDDLDNTLESASQRTAQLKASNQKDKQKQQEVAARIRQLKAKSASLRAQPDTNVDAKRKKLDALQKEADELLALPLGQGAAPKK